MACNKTVYVLALLLAEVSAKEDYKFCDRLAAHIKTVFGQDVEIQAANQAAEDEYVTLDSVLGRGRHEEDSGCDLGNMPK